MSTPHHGYESGAREIVCAQGTCERAAHAAVVWPRSGEAMPFCPVCSTEHVESGAREYPLRSFYDLHGTVSEVGGDWRFQLRDLDDDDQWMEAQNYSDRNDGFAQLEEWQ